MVYLFQILCSVVFLGMTGLLSGENLWLNMISPVIYGRTFDASAPDFPESFSDGLIGGWLPLWLAEKDRALLSGNSYAELYPSDSILAAVYAENHPEGAETEMERLTILWLNKRSLLTKDFGAWKRNWKT